jgi:tetratricopeptide (TPR) repeat protein
MDPNEDLNESGLGAQGYETDLGDHAAAEPYAEVDGWLEHEYDESDDADVQESAPDPYITGLIVFALMVVVALLASTLGIYIYLTTLNRAPRTAAERDIISMEVATKERPNDVLAWVQLAYAYASAGRDSDALRAVQRGENAQNGERLSIVRADVLRFSGHPKEALAAYNEAEKLIQKMFERQKKENAKIGVSADLSDDSLVKVYWGRALVEEQLGDTAAAVKDLEKAVKEQPDQSAILASLGDLYAKTGQAAKARKAYQSALKYVPDMPEALAGLEKLGKAGK